MKPTSSSLRQPPKKVNFVDENSTKEELPTYPLDAVEVEEEYNYDLASEYEKEEEDN